MTTGSMRLQPIAVRRGRTVSRRRSRGRIVTVAVTIGTVVGTITAPAALADSADSLRRAVMAARPATCPPLRVNPLVEQAASAINETTDRWINNASRAVPETDALVPLRDLGYGGTKAVILTAASKNEGDGVKGAVLQGFADIPDCSYTDVGVGASYNAKKDMILMTVVLAA